MIKLKNTLNTRLMYLLPIQIESFIIFLFLLNFRFKVEAIMAPLSHLLVYYVTDEGEPISDVISFDIRLHQNQVNHVPVQIVCRMGVSMSPKYTMK